MKKGWLWGLILVASAMVLVSRFPLTGGENSSEIPREVSPRSGPSGRLDPAVGPAPEAQSGGAIGSDREAALEVPARAGSLLRRQQPPVDILQAHLQRRADEQTLDYLAELLARAESTDPEEREDAVSELGFLEPRPAVIRACLRALSDDVDDVRLGAILALASLEAYAALDKLRELAENDSSLEIREAAAKVYAEFIQAGREAGSFE